MRTVGFDPKGSRVKGQCFLRGSESIPSAVAQKEDERERSQRTGEMGFTVIAIGRGVELSTNLDPFCRSRRRLFKLSPPALPLAERLQRDPEIVLGLRLFERHPLARVFLQRGAEGGDGLLQPRRPALALAEHLQRVAEIELRPRPVEWHPIAGLFL